jgi:phage terminase large subunit
MAAARGLMWAEANEPGVILGGREFMNSLDDSSMAEIKSAIESEPWLAAAYDVGETYIRTKCRRIEFKFVGLRTNATGRSPSLDSIKSKARVKLLWVDEAEPVSETAWAKAIPSVREHDSEIWVTWNPERKTSATHKRFRVNAPDGAKIVEMNWRDNPWFPDVLNDERLEDLSKRPDSYDHVWEGDFKTVTEGAYFTREIAAMKSEGRLGRVSADPLMSLRAFWDIGGTGAKADACAIWVAQFVGREIRVLNYYEAKGQPLSSHVEWLRSNGYGKALCVLPHDGAANDKVFDVSYESALQAAEFETVVVPNQGKGAASKRIEAARRLFPSVWMNKDTTEGGLEALAAYHELIDEKREIGLGPSHDWASHGSDAFGLMCVAYEEPRPNRRNESIRPRNFGVV